MPIELELGSVTTLNSTFPAGGSSSSKLSFANFGGVVYCSCGFVSELAVPDGTKIFDFFTTQYFPTQQTLGVYVFNCDSPDPSQIQVAFVLQNQLSATFEGVQQQYKVTIQNMNTQVGFVIPNVPIYSFDAATGHLYIDNLDTPSLSIVYDVASTERFDQYMHDYFLLKPKTMQQTTSVLGAMDLVITDYGGRSSSGNIVNLKIRTDLDLSLFRKVSLDGCLANDVHFSSPSQTITMSVLDMGAFQHSIVIATQCFSVVREFYQRTADNSVIVADEATFVLFQKPPSSMSPSYQLQYVNEGHIVVQTKGKLIFVQ